MIKNQFKKLLNQAIPNFKEDKSFRVLADNAGKDYCLVRAVELILESQMVSANFDNNIVRAIQLLILARCKNDSTV